MTPEERRAKLQELKQAAPNNERKARLQALKASDVGRIADDPDSAITIPPAPDHSEFDRAIETRDTLITDGVQKSIAARTAFADSALSYRNVPFVSAPLDSTSISAEETVQKIEASQGIDFGVQRPVFVDQLKDWGAQKFDHLAESRMWWARHKHAAAAKAGEMVGDATVNFDFGMATLDWSTYVNKKWKLLHVPKDRRAELESRILPPIEINGKKFKTGTSAAFDVIGQSLRARTEQVTGEIVKMYGDLPQAAFKAGYKIGGGANVVPDNVLQQMGASLAETGNQRIAAQKDQVPLVAAQLGENLTWIEVVNHNQYTKEEMEQGLFYSDLNDMGKYKTISMLGMVLGDALAEMNYDPFMLLSHVSTGAIEGAAKVHARVNPESAARIKGAISRSTWTTTDAYDSYVQAKKNFNDFHEKVMGKAAESKDFTGEKQIPAEDMQKLVKLRQAMLREEMFLDNFKDAGPHERIMPGSARRNPEELPKMKETEVYFQPVGVKGETIDTAAPRGTAPGVRTIGKVRVLDTYPWRKDTADGPMWAQRSEAGQARNTWNFPEDAVRDDEGRVMHLDPMTGKEVWITPPKGKYLGGKRTKISLMEGLRSETRTKPINQVQAELYDIRKRELQAQQTTPIDWNKTDDLPLFQHRQLLGPDDAENAGTGLEHMIKTGGTGVDDITIKPLVPEYGGMPQSQLGLIDWRKIDRANKATAAAKEFENTKQYDIFSSTERMLANHEDIVKRNLGYARAQGDKAKIKLYNKHLNQIKKARRFDMKVQEFDEKWLPPEAQNIMDTPETYNNWMLTAHDRVAASLYPGGFAFNMMHLVSNPTILGRKFMPDSWAEAVKAGTMARPNPFKFFDMWMPGSGQRFRAQILQFDQEHRAWSEFITNEAERAGIIEKRSQWNPKYNWNKYKIHDKHNELAFDILNTAPEAPGYEELFNSAPKPIQEFCGKIRAYLDHQADVQAIPMRGKKGRLIGYIHHVFDRKALEGGARSMEFVGIPRKAEVFAAHLLPRSGVEGYPRDAMLALDVYGRASARKRILEPLYQDIISTGTEIAHARNFPGAQSYANDFVSEMQGRPTFVGAKMDEVVGPVMSKMGKNWVPSSIDRSLMGLSTLIWSGLIAGNQRYPVMQMANAVATTSGRFGLFRTARGLLDMATPEGQMLAKNLGTYQSFESIHESDAFRKISSILTERGYTISPLGVQSTGSIEMAARGMTGLAAVDMHLNKMGFATLDEAKEAGFGGAIAFDSMRSAEEINHMFGTRGRSPWVSRFFPKGLNTAATQFLGFVPKQIEELTYQAGRNPGKIMEFMMVSGWLSRLAAEEQGMDITDYVGMGFAPKELADFTSPAMDGWMSMLDFMEAASNRDPEEATKAADKVVNSLAILVPTMGQVERTMRDVERYNSGVVYSASGEKQRNLVKGLSGEGTSMPSFGGDLIPTLLGQRSIRDKLFSMGQDAMRSERKSKFFARKEAVTNMINAYDENRFDDFDKNVQKVADLGMPLSGDMIEQVRKAREISWVFRTVENDPVLIEDYMTTIDNFGIDWEP